MNFFYKHLVLKVHFLNFMTEGKTHKFIFIFGWGKQCKHFKFPIVMEKRLVRFLSPLTFLSRQKRDGFISGSGTQTNVKITVSMEQRGWVGDLTGVAVSAGMLRVFSEWWTWWWSWLGLMILKDFSKLNDSVILWLKAEPWISLLCLTEMSSCALDSWIPFQPSAVMRTSLRPPESKVCLYLAACPT